MRNGNASVQKLPTSSENDPCDIGINFDIQIIHQCCKTLAMQFSVATDERVNARNCKALLVETAGEAAKGWQATNLPYQIFLNLRASAAVFMEDLRLHSSSCSTQGARCRETKQNLMACVSTAVFLDIHALLSNDTVSRAVSRAAHKCSRREDRPMQSIGPRIERLCKHVIMEHKLQSSHHPQAAHSPCSAHEAIHSKEKQNHTHAHQKGVGQRLLTWSGQQYQT